jgi:O-antigen biosynthesis protein WbqP
MNLRKRLKRQSDITLALPAAATLLIPGLIVALLVRITSTGPIFYWSDRVGENNRIFKMPKFRSMRTDTPAVATHLLKDPKACLTPIGGFLRKTSLDELPQLWSILTGDMSFVGPAPPYSIRMTSSPYAPQNPFTASPPRFDWLGANQRA